MKWESIKEMLPVFYFLATLTDGRFNHKKLRDLPFKTRGEGGGVFANQQTNIWTLPDQDTFFSGSSPGT
jgi:hypothetical protein